MQCVRRVPYECADCTVVEQRFRATYASETQPFMLVLADLGSFVKAGRYRFFALVSVHASSDRRLRDASSRVVVAQIVARAGIGLRAGRGSASPRSGKLWDAPATA